MIYDFRGKPWRAGDSTVITIPSYLIRNEKVKEKKEYKITIQELEEANKNDTHG